MSHDQVTLAKDQLYQLLKEVRREAIPLVDAFDIPDRMLNSALGSYDGDVYNRLFQWALKAPRNKKKVVTILMILIVEVICTYVPCFGVVVKWECIELNTITFKHSHMHTRTHTHTYMHPTHTRTHTTHTRTHTYVHARTHTHTHTHAHTHTCTHTCTHTHMHACMHIRIHATHTHACTHACMRA